ncbi:hypothetical protein JTE90_023114 [Oedothorax gibbosus]|uniref:Endonuclease/exonuclease/phosphatase domain-containing protein n=1 Tax=Oedothorax gibbosus TaxID=931172 RepID=A0AAV6UNT6_9ARAC|nr:hypothetical protein JTE90_023114 [Oedothorax gibbosus]
MEWAQICFCSVYMAYDRDSTREFFSLVSHCKTNNIPMILGCDANAHHTSWGRSDINNRGEKLLEYLRGTNLIWVNKGNRPTFINKRRGEVIDLTLVSLDISYLIDNWHVSDSPTLSDHALIQFHVKDEIPVERIGMSTIPIWTFM